MDEQSNSIMFPTVQNQQGVNDIHNHLLLRFRTAVLFLSAVPYQAPGSGNKPCR